MFDKPVDKYADILTLGEYVAAVGMGALIDYDGFGFPVKDGMEDDTNFIYPSEGFKNIPEGTTHIAWYNK